MKKAEIIFSKFSKNLQNICSYWDFELEEKFQKESYICPLSFKIFSKDGLSSEYEDQLTIEHIPPESLRGKALCLTNRISNSKSGQTLDHAILNHIKNREFKEGISGIELKVFIENVKMDGYFDFTNKEQPKFNFYYKKKHQGHERVLAKMVTDQTFNLKFTVAQDNRKALISFIRIAYLYAFSHLGYSLIFGATKLLNPNFDLIRDQINNPEETIIKDIVLIDKNLNDIDSGLYIIYEPKEYRSLFVVFNLNTVSREWKYGVFLPGADDFGFEAIANIKRALAEYEKIDFKYHAIPILDLTNLYESVYYYKYWQE